MSKMMIRFVATWQFLEQTEAALSGDTIGYSGS